MDHDAEAAEFLDPGNLLKDVLFAIATSRDSRE